MERERERLKLRQRQRQRQRQRRKERACCKKAGGEEKLSGPESVFIKLRKMFLNFSKSL